MILWYRPNGPAGMGRISHAYADNPSALLLCVIDLDLKGKINYATIRRAHAEYEGTYGV